MKPLFSLFLLSAFLFSGCSEENLFEYETIDIPAIDNIEFTKSEEVSNGSLNDYSVSLLNKIAEEASEIENEQGNILISPLSLSCMLAMTANSGDKGMEKAVCELLGQDDIQSLNTTFNKLIRFLKSSTNGGNFVMANSVWVDENTTPESYFTGILNNTFYSDIYSINLNDNKSTNIINNWCETKTDGLIKKVTVNTSDQLRFCVVNALTYEGEWINEFDPLRTKSDIKFNGRDGESTIAMMHNELSSQNYENDDFVSIVFPFKGQTDMIFILPKEDKNVYDVAKRMSPSTLTAIKEDYKDEMTALSLPKFTCSSSDKDLINMLYKMGIPETIVPTLSGISEETKVSVRQTNTINVYEKGAKAASVTIDDLSVTAPRIVREININRPFIFLIENKVTETILMAGIINNL